MTPKRSKIGAWVAGWILAAWPSPGSASPVNAETLRATQGKAGWVGSESISGGYRSGNVNKVEFSNDGFVQYQNVFPIHMGHGWAGRPLHAPAFFRDRWVLVSNLKWAMLDGTTFLNSGYAHSRYTRMFVPRFGGDFFIQTQYNQFTRLKARLIGGLGVRVDAIHREKVSVWGGSGYMAEYEVNDVEPTDTHPAVLLNHRWTNYVVLQLFLADARVMFQNTVYAQPLFIDFADVRVLESAALEGAVTPVFSMGVNFDLQYDSRPPQTVVPVDISLASYLKFSFG